MPGTVNRQSTFICPVVHKCDMWDMERCRKELQRSLPGLWHVHITAFQHRVQDKYSFSKMFVPFPEDDVNM